MSPAAGTVVQDVTHLKTLQQAAHKPYYVYVLRRPDGQPCFNGKGTPFYVGLGQGLRLFSHVQAARDPAVQGTKVAVIREIWAAGCQVVHCIDSWHDHEPWDREEELIRLIGQIKHGTGSLANEQDYAPSFKVNGIELRKYREAQGDDPLAMPTKFKLADVRLTVGPRKPRSPTSVFGKIYSVLEEHPGILGKDLVNLLRRTDFAGNRSAYTQSGAVSVAWLCGYIEGGLFRADRRHVGRYEVAPDE